MNVNRLWKMGLACAAAVVLAGTSWATAAPVLYEIAPVGASTATQGRAITSDGRYVVGTPGTGTSEGFIWDSVGGSRWIDASGARAHDAVGVGYRTYNGQQEIVVFGNSTGGTPGPTYWISSDGGVTFAPKLRRTGVSSEFPSANALTSSSAQADAWYDVWNPPWDNVNDQQMCVELGSGAPALPQQDTKNVPKGAKSKLLGVSSSGLAVGWRKETTTDDSGNVQGYILQHDGDGGLSGNYYPNGLRVDDPATTTLFENRYGQLWAVAAFSNTTDNRAGGMGPVDPDDPWTPARTGNWPYIVDDFSGNNTGTATELPTFDRVDHGAATNGIVYGLSADGNYAVGMDYTLGVERAVLWDLSDPEPANWTETNLTDFASTEGILGNFTSLRRAYSIGITNGMPAITGYGVTLDEFGNPLTRGFVLYFDLVVHNPGDANSDGVVDSVDASALGAHWLMQSGATWEMGDFNGDYMVDDKDAAILAANWSSGVGEVPEPGAFVLLASALAAAALGFRRR